jgi:hypothetical protein
MTRLKTWFEEKFIQTYVWKLLGLDVMTKSILVTALRVEILEKKVQQCPEIRLQEAADQLIAQAQVNPNDPNKSGVN